VKGRRHTQEQIVRKLREADRLLGEGKNVAEVAKELGISEHTFGRWRNQSGHRHRFLGHRADGNDGDLFRFRPPRAEQTQFRRWS
jgi:transposase-like protein